MPRIVRAVQLDIVPDMTTAAFIRSLKRFSARRGLPRKFVSDNGKTFKAAAKAIDTMMRDKAIQEYLSDSRSNGCSTWREPRGGEVFSNAWCG